MSRPAVEFRMYPPPWRGVVHANAEHISPRSDDGDECRRALPLGGHVAPEDCPTQSSPTTTAGNLGRGEPKFGGLI